MLVGGVIGLTIGLGLFLARAVDQRAITIASVLCGACIGIGLLLALVNLATAGSKGGDAGMAAITWVVLAFVAVVVATPLALAIGLIQRLRFGGTVHWATLTLVIDAACLGITLETYRRIVLLPAERAVTNSWWAEEQARRKELTDIRNRIPMQYRGISSAMLDDIERRERLAVRAGKPMPASIPQSVRNAIRNAENSSLRPGVPLDVSSLAAVGHARDAFTKGVALGWVFGAALLPFAFPLRRRRGADGDESTI